MYPENWFVGIKEKLIVNILQSSSRNAGIWDVGKINNLCFDLMLKNVRKSNWSSCNIQKLCLLAEKRMCNNSSSSFSQIERVNERQKGGKHFQFNVSLAPEGQHCALCLSWYHWAHVLEAVASVAMLVSVVGWLVVVVLCWAHSTSLKCYYFCLC